MSNYQLRYYQQEAVDSIYDYFSHNSGNPLVAMPTGTGKSVVIGDFIKSAFQYYPDTRIMMLTHVKELIQQNAEKLTSMWANAPLGIYSAGLKSKDYQMPIVFGGIQSVAKNPEIFGFRDLILVDEAHLVSDKEDSQYLQTFKALKEFNPKLKAVGFTATAYRQKMGSLTDGGLFTDICYDITGVEAFNRLIAEGYMSMLIPKATKAQLDVSEVGITAGDFNAKQLNEAVDKNDLNYLIVNEIVEQGFDRQSWLVFATSIKHAEHLAELFNNFGIVAAAVHSKLGDAENTARIGAFKRGEIRALVNNDKLTTGFDHPPIDLIAMVRPTHSCSLWVQMLGRGTRPSPDTQKSNCLVLDFAQNTKRLGAINDPVKPRKPTKGAPMSAPVRICPECGVYNHASATTCFSCGFIFPSITKLFEQTSSLELVKGEEAQIEWFDVTKIIYTKHEKKSNGGLLLAPPSLKVSYFSGLKMFNEWIAIESEKTFARQRAKNWWLQRSLSGILPISTNDALMRTNDLRKPKRVKVWVNKQYPEVLGYDY